MELINYSTLTPTIGGSFSNGWEVMKKYFFYLLIVVIVVGLVTGPTMHNRYDGSDLDFHWSIGFVFLAIFAVAYGFLFVPIITYSSKLIYLDAVRDKEIELKKLIAGFHNYINIVLANLLKVTLIIMGTLFFIIPGIILACRLAFVSYLVMDKGLDPVQALDKSWKMTRGLGWNIFFMAIISFFIGVCGLILLIIGIFPALIWIHSSFASLYQGALNKEEPVI